MKAVTGCLAILLGGLGVLLTLAMIVLVWWGAFTITAQTETVTTHTGKALVEIEEGIGTLRQQLGSNTNSVEEIRVVATKVNEEPNAQARQAAVEQLQEKLIVLIEQTRTMSELLPPAAEGLDKAANLAEKNDDKPRADRLRAIAESVREAAKELEALRTEAATIRQGESTLSAKEVAGLAQRTRKTLDRLTTALSDLKKETETFRGDLPQVGRAFNRWVYLGAAILTAVLVWIGLGQLAIISWGRRRLALRAVTAPQAVAPTR